MKLPEIELTIPKKSVMFILAVCLITFLLKAPSFSENLEYDEALKLFLGKVLICGDGFFSVQWSHHGSALFTTFAAVYALFGASSETLHAVAALFSVFTAVFIYLFSRSLFDSRVAVFASLFFAIFSSSRSLQGTLAAVEVFTIFFTTLGFYLYVLYRQRDSGRILVLSGLSLGTALLYKQTSGLDYLCLVLFILAVNLYSHKRDKLRAEIILPITLLTVGFLLPLIAFTIFFFATDRLFDFIYWFFLEGFHYAKTQHAFGPGWHGFVTVVTGNTWMIWLLSLLGVVSSILFMHSKERLFCVLWMALAMIGVSLSGWFFPHYFIQLLPAASILAALFVADVYRWGREGLGSKVFVYKNVFFSIFLLVSLILCFKGDYSHLGHYFRYWAGDIDKREYLTRAFNIPWQDRYDASEYLRANMHPDETFYVWDSCMHVYLLSEKMLLTKHIYKYAMLNEDLVFPTFKGRFSNFSENRKELMTTFYANNPNYIALYAQPEKIFDEMQVFKEFSSFLQDRYSFVKRFGNILIFRRAKVPRKCNTAEEKDTIPIEILKRYSALTQIKILATCVEVNFEPMVNPNGILRSFKSYYSNKSLGVGPIPEALGERVYTVMGSSVPSIITPGAREDKLLQQALKALGVEFIPISAEFLGQDGRDYVSNAALRPSGNIDLHICINGPAKPISFLRVKCRDRQWNTKSYGVNPVIKTIRDGKTTDIYFERSLDTKGKIFEIYIVYEDGTVAIAQTYGIATGPDVSTHRDGDRIVVYKLDSDTVELYDLAKDPAQENNLVANDAERAEELKKRYFSLKARTGESIEVVDMEQGEADLVGTHTEGASGREDIHIRLKGPDRPVKKVRVDMGNIIWVGPIDGIHYCAKFVQKGGQTDIYFEPVKEKVEPVKVTVIFEDKLYATATSDKVDP